MVHHIALKLILSMLLALHNKITKFSYFLIFCCIDLRPQTFAFFKLTQCPLSPPPTPPPKKKKDGVS